jgi:hypothetical protein
MPLENSYVYRVVIGDPLAEVLTVEYRAGWIYVSPLTETTTTPKDLGNSLAAQAQWWEQVKAAERAQGLPNPDSYDDPGQPLSRVQITAAGVEYLYRDNGVVRRLTWTRDDDVLAIASDNEGAMRVASWRLLFADLRRFISLCCGPAPEVSA